MSESKVIYSEDGKFAYFNGHKYHRTQNGYYERHELLHVAVMEEHIGKSITLGYVVHHNTKDENGSWDKSKNNIENLKLLTKSEHTKIHSKDKDKNKVKNIKPKIAVCKNCGREFESYYHGGKNKPCFCKKECQREWIRTNELEERICVICGTKFTVCKYKPTQTCSKSCTVKLGHEHRKTKK